MPKVMDISYKCEKCGRIMPEKDVNEIFTIPLSDRSQIICVCGGNVRPVELPGITGTRDGFGIGRKFMHADETGTREITTWREWEKAGYKDAISHTRNKNIARMAKDKMKRIKAKGGKSML